MNTRFVTFAGFAFVIGTGLYFTTMSVQSQDFLKSPVNLQAANPGFSQAGNANISGTMRAGQFIGNMNVPSGAASGKVLTSDAIGNASWQLIPPPTFPMTGSTNTTTPTLTLLNTTSGTALVAQNSGGAGWAISASGGALGVRGTAVAIDGEGGSFSGAGIGVRGDSASTGVLGIGRENGSVGVRGEGVTGVIGVSNVGGEGVTGISTGATSTGVLGTVDGSGSAGVIGSATSQSGTIYGVLGTISSANAVSGAGIRGASSIPSGGIGVEGFAQTGTTSRGGQFESQSPAGFGVFGLASATGSLQSHGGWFQSNSTGGRGVYGYTPATTGFTYAVFGVADSVDGRGVYGFAGNAAGTPYGVYGRTPAGNAGYAVYANGDFGATGVKSFRIDHPFDPLNKYLLHYAAESPFPQNFYSGNTVTDKDGFAWVQLPDYFESINANFKYQLTVLGKSFARAVVWDEIEGGRFRIRTDAPGIKVSWRIEADRNDAYVKYKQPKDVVNKRDTERGKYLAPEIFGEPDEMGIDHQPSATAKR